MTLVIIIVIALGAGFGDVFFFVCCCCCLFVFILVPTYITFNSRGEDRLVGLVVKASASRVEDLGFESRLRRDFLDRVESYQYLRK